MFFLARQPGKTSSELQLIATLGRPDRLCSCIKHDRSSHQNQTRSNLPSQFGIKGNRSQTIFQDITCENPLTLGRKGDLLNNFFLSGPLNKRFSARMAKPRRRLAFTSRADSKLFSISSANDSFVDVATPFYAGFKGKPPF